MTLMRIERLRARMESLVDQVRRSGGVGLPEIRDGFWTTLPTVAEGPGGDAFVDALDAVLDAAEAQVDRELARRTVSRRGPA